MPANIGCYRMMRLFGTIVPIIMLQRRRNLMMVAPSVFSLAASGLYSLVFLACLTASLTAVRFRQASWYVRVWIVLAVWFGVLITIRLTNAEEWVRTILRESMRESSNYADRRAFQAPIVAAILAIAGLGSLALLYRLTRNLKGRRDLAALAAILAAVAIAFLIILRLVSLHIVDALLYGALKLNWVIDVGASLIVLVAAVVYVRVLRASVA